VFSLDIKVSTGARGSFPALWNMSFININCRRHLADFFRMVQNTPARWHSIISNENGCDERNIGSLFSFLGMSYSDLYLPLMISCGLIRRTTSNRLKTTKFSPSIDGVDYTWENFFTEFLLEFLICICQIQKVVRRSCIIFASGNLRTRFPVSQYWNRCI
jgi:hypothetical protein